MLRWFKPYPEEVAFKTALARLYDRPEGLDDEDAFLDLVEERLAEIHELRLRLDERIDANAWTFFGARTWPP